MIDQIQFQKLLPHATSSKYGGVILKNSSIVNTRLYLQELWSYLGNHFSSIQLIQQPILSLDSIASQYDLIIVACGSYSHHLWSSIQPFIHLTRGYNLVYPDPAFSSTHNSSMISPLQHAILSGEYVIPHPSQPNHLLCGATKESLPPLSSSSSNHLTNNQKSIQDIKQE